MIAILSRLFSKPNPFLYLSNVRFSTGIVPVHQRRLSKYKHLDPDYYVVRRRGYPSIFDTLVGTCGLCPHFASFKVSRLPESASRKTAYSILPFLRENGFTPRKIEWMLRVNDEFLRPEVNVDDIKLKLKLLHDLGLSSREVVNIISDGPSILYLSTEDHIIPSINKVKDLLGSNERVAKFLIKCPILLASEDSLQNLEIVKSYGVPMDRILAFLYNQPAYFWALPTDLTRMYVDRAISMGASPTSRTFLHSIFAGGNWKANLENLQDMGFSKDDSLAMCMKAPYVFKRSTKKIKSAIELLLATGKYDMSHIVANPSCLGFSIEKRLKPRLQNLQLVEIEKWPSLPTMCRMPKDKFEERFLVPYLD